jgi:hypothetical protein
MTGRLALDLDAATRVASASGDRSWQQVRAALSRAAATERAEYDAAAQTPRAPLCGCDRPTRERWVPQVRPGDCDGHAERADAHRRGTAAQRPRAGCHPLARRWSRRAPPRQRRRFWVRTVEDKQTVEVILTFDSAYRENAALRSKAWGTTPSEPTDEERATALLVMRAPVDWLLPRPQVYSELRPAAGTPLRPLRGEAMTEPPEIEWQRILNCVRTFTGKDMTVGEMAHACNTDTGAIVAALEELGEREAPDS